MSYVQPKRSGRPGWVWPLAIGIFVVLVALAWVIGWLAGEPLASPASSRSPAVSVSSSVSAPRVELTARKVADQLGQLYPLPNRRDNTGFGSNAGVVEAITTDAVTVLRFDTEQHAQAWVDGFTKAGSADVRRAGVFVLSWATQGEQDLTSDGARAAMLGELQRLVGA